MKNDLDKNSLLDDGLDVGKKVMSEYERVQQWSMYLMIGKGVAVLTILGLLAWGGFALVSGMKSMVTDAAISEVSEKADELKLKASGKVAKIKADVAAKLEASKKKKDGDETKQTNILGAITMFAKSIDAKLDEGVDSALIDSGYHPDAPGFCAFSNPDPVCEHYSDAEIGGSDYESLVLWKAPCPDVYAEAMSRLNLNGKVTENDKRMLQVECNNYADVLADKKREETKQKMLDGAGL